MKRPVLHRLFSGFMALLVLTASVGLTVLSHTCRSSGRSTASIIFSAPEHKCPPAAEAQQNSHLLSDKAQLKKSCCEFDAHFHKLDATAHALAKHLVPSFTLALPPVASWVPFAPSHLLAQATAWHASDSSPPLRAGRHLLAFVCTWRV
ncbi:hypothetical protein LGH70_09595 [Hymenobacter sp. BT635]|uniref:Uncharacterized protein n=1 Tax=Hymenobacter nitidus TaxID=2880929 RepID=A0ABS8ACE9_9BACT|nr:hypothetical protein [Hymenobacter nitidus]MCB2377834.1 hypothetical protein [Hymenobacter nitidus]